MNVTRKYAAPKLEPITTAEFRQMISPVWAPLRDYVLHPVSQFGMMFFLTAIYTINRSGTSCEKIAPAAPALRGKVCWTLNEDEQEMEYLFLSTCIIGLFISIFQLCAFLVIPERSRKIRIEIVRGTSIPADNLQNPN